MEFFWMMMYFLSQPVQPSGCQTPYVEDNRPRFEYWNKNKTAMVMAPKDSIVWWTPTCGNPEQLFMLDTKKGEGARAT